MVHEQPAMLVSVAPDALGGGSNIDIVVPARSVDFANQAPGASDVTQPSTSAAMPGFTTLTTPGAAGQPSAPAVEITINTEGEQEAIPGASHLEGLSVQQMLDLDIDSLALKIDRHHQHTKKAVLDHFMETKARLMQAQNDAVEEEKRNGAARLAAKEEELNLLKGELEAARTKGQRLWDMLGRSCAAFGNAKERRRSMALKFQLFYAWREQALALAQRRRRAERAERWYAEVHLKRNTFRAWFRESMRAHRVTINNRYIQEVDNTKRQIDDHYKAQIDDLQQMLADAHVQLEREAEARSRLEDNMKRAFMRGVCALNIEAMSIMKRGAPPGGANPFGISLPPAGEQPTGADLPAQTAGTSTSAAPSGPGPQGAGAAPLSDVNLDLRGSITLSPARTACPAAAAGSSGGSFSYPGGSGGGSAPQAARVGPTMAHSSSAPSPGPNQTSTTGTIRSAGGGMLAGPTVYTAGAGASSRPASSSGYGGGGLGAAGAPLVVKAGSAMPPSGTYGMAGPAAGNSDATPALRETAQSFYQRPQVMVTRGPGIGVSSEVPRPRTGAPLPTVRMN